MPKNQGKKFEEDIQKSVPDHWFCYRLKDSSGSWSKDESKSRFTPKNMADFFIFNTEEKLLYAVECKSFLGKSMSWKNMNDKNDKKLIKMCAMGKKQNCLGLYIFNFRDLNETYVINANVLKTIKDNSDRKSLSLKEVRLRGVLIRQKLKRVRYSYKLEGRL